MAMMKCPHCGVENSEKRHYCYQCEGDLRGKPKETHDYMETCAGCAKANLFPPAGIVLNSEQVWCMAQNQVVSASQVAGDCFEQAFGWSRENILD
jgi:hypothetical protein